MVDGAFSQRINERLDELAEVEAAYADVRSKGMELYLVQGDRMLALPDIPREAPREGELTMNAVDWEKYSALVREGFVKYELSQKNYLFNRGKSDEELRKQGLAGAESHLEHITEYGRTMRPLTSDKPLKLFSAEKIREALRGEAPKVDYDDVDLC